MTYLREDEFLQYAPDEVDAKTRANHESPDCSGGSNSMVVERKHDGVYAKCFRCGKFGRSLEGKSRSFFGTAKGGHAGGSSSFSDRIPSDATQTMGEWPSRARLWLAQARISPLETKAYGISYSPSMGRVVLPITYKGEYIGHLSRRIFDDGTPKYVMRSKQPTKMLFRVANEAHSGVVVLCEDVLSAIRLGKYVTTFAILGTSVSDFALRELTKGREHAVIFLDYDNRIVIKKSRVLRNRLELLIDKVSLVNAPIDPKNLSDKELSDILISYI